MLVSYVLISTLLSARGRALFLEELQTNALEMARSCAALIDAKALSEIRPGMEDSEAYITVRTTLEAFRDNTDLEYVYTVWYDDNGNPAVYVDSDMEDTAYIGETFGYSDATISALNGTPAVDDVPVTDAWGTHISAYAPVYLDGEICGVAAVDLDHTWVTRELRKMQQLMGVLSVVCLLVSMLIMWWISRYLAERFRLLDAKIEDLSFEAEELRRIEGLQRGDEFEMIADHINEVFMRNSSAQMEEADKLRKAMAEVERKAAEEVKKVKEAAGQTEEMIPEGADETVHNSTAGESVVDMTEEPAQTMETPTQKREEAIGQMKAQAPQVIASYRSLLEQLRPLFEVEAQEEAAATDTIRGIYEAHAGSLDYLEAAKYLVNEDLMEKTLVQFYESIPESLAALEGYLEAGDYENFTIKVHALKSSARLIGATQLSQMALEMEMRGKRLLKEDGE